MNEVKQKSTVISDRELNMIYDRVLCKRPYFRDIDFSETIWDDCIPFLDELVQDAEPDIYISTTKNKLRKIKETVKPEGWNFCIRKSDIIAFQLYVILFYRFRDDKVYVKVRESLKEMLGFFNDPTRCSLNESLRYMQDLPLNNELLEEDLNTSEDKVQISRAAQIGLLVRLFEESGVNFNNYSGAKAALARLGEEIYEIPEKTINNYFSRTSKINSEDKLSINMELKEMGVEWRLE